jgi:hypothetical protein
MSSPSYNRRGLPTPPIIKGNDDNEPRQILLPIGGGIVGKLASSTTNLSYRKLFNYLQILFYSKF